MDTIRPSPRRRGRPPRQRDHQLDTRDLLLRAGLIVLTEKGFSSSGLDEILKQACVPKGSFYHYFDSKEAFGKALIDCYASYFVRKLERHLQNPALSHLDRIAAFIADAQEGMQRYEFKRGCLIGNLGQEMGSLPESFREQLGGVFRDWQQRFTRVLEAAQAAGEICPQVDCSQMAAFFWIGWEGAVLRAKLERSNEPLQLFAACFFRSIR
ncbi:TetR family transcriptional regulator [Aeromonas sp. 2HA2]|uniref:acrylate utilization transcriptional regulator AcuR n=1 Tax=Aeromonas TaxID=642 RepID=UPI00223F892D|nr:MULTISPECIES: TetR/AcrR family transcriptional regulator [Aeromonas]ELI6431407.1 TetR/AcrR family transcriptional regulator [Aeromonas salmonicida subsp. salmonicida]MDF2409731.1 TetR family transcriptional regulator [Aeromonas sp. 2HA2]MDM5062825.1 TetR/AcrR family transcriptional regulator [Aeromonas salmonicida]MDM5150353.1 TetR/AcrR family transcriptional regulator [Aeromonas salmonicida]